MSTSLAHYKLCQIVFSRRDTRGAGPNALRGYECEAPGRTSAVQKALNTASDQCPRQRWISASAAARENAGR